MKYRVVFERTVEPENKEKDKQYSTLIMGYYDSLEETTSSLRECVKLFAFREKEVKDFGYMTVMPMEIDDYVYPEILVKGKWTRFLSYKEHEILLNETTS